jgi:hypothetical protein
MMPWRNLKSTLAVLIRISEELMAETVYLESKYREI